MQNRKQIIIFPLFACGSLIAGETPKPKPESSPRMDPGSQPERWSTGRKRFRKFDTRLRYTTVFVLPKSEKIMDFVCGDKENWVINGADNFAYVKPEKEKARTNLNLVTASGNVYSFLVVRRRRAAGPESLRPAEGRDHAHGARQPRRSGFRRAKLRRLKEQARTAHEEARKATEAAAKSAAEQVDAFRTAYPGKLKHVYRFADREPFQVSAIAHDDKFTYIWANPQETPALYEIKDGKPNLISSNSGTVCMWSTRFWTTAISPLANTGSTSNGRNRR